MNFRTTLILGVLLLGAVVFLFVSNRGSSTDSDKPAPTATDPRGGKKLLDVKADDLTKLVIRPTGGDKTIEMSKTGEKWSFVQPIAWPAEVFETRTFIESLANLKARGSVDLNGENKASTGLDKPRYQVEMTDKGGKVYTLSVGNRSALGNDLYVAVAGESQGRVVPGGALADKLDKGIEKLVASLRDKQLVRLPTDEVKQVEVTTPAGPRVVARKVGADWKVVEPAQVDADTAEMTDLISAMTGLKASEFSDESASATAGAQFDRPRATVWLSNAAPSTQPTTAPASGPAVHVGGTEVVIGQVTDVEAEKSWVRVSDPRSIAQVSLNAAALERITKASPLTLRDRRAVNIDPETVAEIVLATDRPATTQPTTMPAEQHEMRLARRKENLTLGPVAPPTTGPASAPSTGPSTGPSTAPATGPATQATASTQPDVTKPLTKWVIESDGSANADDPQVTALLTELHPLKATRYLEHSPTTQPAPTYTLTIKTIGAGGAGQATHVLTVTDPGGDAKLVGHYNDLTFELDRALLKKLTGDFKTPVKEELPPGHPPLGGPGGFPGGLPGGFPGE